MKFKDFAGKNILYCVLSVLLAVYLVIALRFTSVSAANDPLARVEINVVDSESRGFVKAVSIADELSRNGMAPDSKKRGALDLDSLESWIMENDNVETVNCYLLSNGKLRIDVTPLMPLARVFDGNENYYINRAGKRMSASIHYRMDVPVICGNFNANRRPDMCFPLIDYIADHPELATMTSAIEVASNNDILLVPAVKGHVVNLGNCNDLENKFERLGIFYDKVLKVKGWEYYDTISVKWRGQVVAKRSNYKPAEKVDLKEDHSDLDDVGTMSSSQEDARLVRVSEPDSLAAQAKNNKQKTTDGKADKTKTTEKTAAKPETKANGNSKTKSAPQSTAKPATNNRTSSGASKNKTTTNTKKK